MIKGNPRVKKVMDNFEWKDDGSPRLRNNKLFKEN
jgi:hypothetical protein